MRNLNDPIPEVTQITFRIIHYQFLTTFRFAYVKILNAVLAGIIVKGIP